MSDVFYVREQQSKIKNKRTRQGYKNPRLVYAERADKAQKKMAKEIAHTWRHLSKDEIAEQYSSDKVADLIKRAQDNLAAMSVIDKVKSENVEVPE